MSLCTCGHTQKEHLSSDRLDNSCQVDECECSNYAIPTEEQRKRFAQLGWIDTDTDRQDSSEPDTSTHEGHQATGELEGQPALLNESSLQGTKTNTGDINSNGQANFAHLIALWDMLVCKIWGNVPSSIA